MKRRVFINDNESYYQIFTLSQEKDGSIYAHWPAFEKTKWLLINEGVSGPTLLEYENTTESMKLTVHATGLAGFRGGPGTKFYGNKLLDPNSYGLRHLFTAQLLKPNNVPLSPYGARKSDYLINAKYLPPTIIIFFAIPKSQFKLELGISMQESDVIFSSTGEPQHVLGFDIIELDQHMVVWLAYTTKNLNWPPTRPYIFYTDGFKVPVVIGEGGRRCRYELRMPEYTHNGKNVSIQI